MNPKYERFIKKSQPGKKSSKKDDGEFSLPGFEAEPAGTEWPKGEEEAEPKSFYQIQRTCGNDKWLKQNHPPARASFNVFNTSLHPDRPLADGLAVVPIKGTSFPDKRLGCLAVAEALISGSSTGEVLLMPEPENTFDPNAVAVVDKATMTHLGYIPKAAGANETYAAAMAAGRLCGAYIIEAKLSNLKGEPNAMLLVATGWKKHEESETI